jgi:C4-dicarboxylate transporter, DctM subunit
MLGTALFLLIVLLAISVPVAAVMGVLGLALNEFYSSMPLYRAMGDIIWNSSAEYILIAIPMFVMLGEILLRSGIAVRVYNAIAKWLSWLPGGLMHANIGTCAIFAATSGSSVATAATVGVVALPQVKIRGYDESLFLGTLAAGGTLGILIPPSINFILYGLITSTSVPRLYLAGMIPGLLLTSFFMLIVLIYCLVSPEKGGTRIETSWSDRLASLKDLGAPLFIFFIVVGSIYLGWATPTEAASMGVFAALVLAAWERALSWKMLRAVFEGTMRTTAMIMLIIIAAQFLNFVLASIGLTDGIGNLIEGLGLGKYGTMVLIVVFYLILGCFMETISMMILTTPFIFPIITKLGWDAIWWGVVLTILIEAALVTPPVGLNLYVVQSLRERGPIADVIRGALPFVIGMVVLIGLLMILPDVALWLPNSIMGKGG